MALVASILIRPELLATIGLDCGSEGDQDADGLEQAEPDDAGHHLIRGNTISDNGAAGIVAYRSTGTRIIGNIIERNNSEGFYSYESGGIKNHFFIDGVIEGNLVRDNDAVGIWLDNTNHRSRVSRNVVLRNRGAGIFLEMTFGPILVDNNVVALTVPTHNMAGDGIYAHDASEVTLMHNLILANANYGVWAHIATNRRARHPELGMTEVGASDWRIQNNIIAGNHRGALSMPMESPRSRNNRSDFNVFAGGFDPLRGAQPSVPNAPARFGLNSNGGRTPIPAGAAPAMLEARLTLDEWREITQQDEHSRDGIVLNANMNVAQPRLRLTVDRADLGADMPGHPEITHDLLGRPWTAENRKAGPLTALVEVPRLSDEAERGRSVRGVRRNEVNYLPLWPLPGVSTD
jgi:parallel beta-helix repeat protein